MYSLQLICSCISLISKFWPICWSLLLVKISSHCNWRGSHTDQAGPSQRPDHMAAALRPLIPADCSYIPSRHFKNEIICCVYSLAKRVRLKKRRDSSRLHHAKCINISIWCLILSPLPLTPLAPLALITGPELALPGQGHVVGVCYECATWSQRCLWVPGGPACWR